MTERTLPATTLWAIAGCGFASMASMRICDAMLSAIGAGFAVGTAEAAVTISAFALAYGVCQLFFGPLGDRFGKPKVIAVTTLCCAVFNALAMTARSLDQLTLWRAASGASAAGIIPLAMAWIGDHAPYGERQLVLAKLLNATVFGMIAGQFLGGLLADSLGWAASFAMLALLFGLSGGVLAAQTRGAPAPKPAGGALPAGRLAVLRDPWARVVFAVVLLEGAFAYSALALAPTHLQARLDLSMRAAGGIAAGYGLGGLAFAWGARRLLKRLAEAQVARLGGLCVACGWALFALAPNLYVAAPACALAGFGFYALHNTLQVTATELSATARGTAVSLFACSLFLGQSGGILVGGWLAQHVSTQAVYLVCSGGILVLGMVFAGLVQRRNGELRERALGR